MFELENYSINIESGIPDYLKVRLVDVFDRGRDKFSKKNGIFDLRRYGEIQFSEQVLSTIKFSFFNRDSFEELLSGVDLDLCRYKIYKNELYDLTVNCGEVVELQINERYVKYCKVILDRCFHYVLSEIIRDGFDGYVGRDYFLEYVCNQYNTIYLNKTLSDDDFIIKKEGVCDLVVTKHAAQRLSRRSISADDVVESFLRCDRAKEDDLGNLRFETDVVTVVTDADRSTLITAFYNFEFSSGDVWRKLKRDHNRRLRKVIFSRLGEFNESDRVAVEKYVLYGE